MEYLKLGTINDTFGLDGTLKIYSTTNQANKRYQPGNKVFLVNPQDNAKEEYTVVSFRHSGLFDFVKFEEVNDINTAQSKKGYEVQVVKDNKDLDEGSYYYSDLRGCKVFDQTGKEIGVVKEVEEFPAQLTLRVSRSRGSDFFIPFIKQFIIKVDIEKKAIFAEIIEGLL